MKPRLVRWIGGALLVVGGLGFLFAAVGLSSADRVSDVRAPAGMSIVRPADDPQVQARKRQAEKVLFASLLAGGAGAVTFAAGLISGRRSSGAAGQGVRGR